ncbi:helix-turn-helix domain-containing protein [Methylosinus sporium]|uniref:helix-turn-helix domain-containing protein n=1 Tax=Methylosinus sporium TaxID=428 RepID=UPI00383AC7A9
MLEVAPLLRKLILHILTIGMLAPEHPEHHRIAGLLIDLMLAARHEDLMLPLPRDARAMRLAERWRQIPGDSQDLAALAMEVGASLRTLRLFPNATGLTIEEWRQKARTIHAIGRLAAGVSVTDTALHCGYQSPAAFTRQFGVSPGRYRV